MKTFRFDLDFACTLHKLQVCVITPAAMAAERLLQVCNYNSFLQGATKLQVLLDATKHTTPPHITWEMLLVALSRCRRPQDFLIFGDGHERFANLKPDINTVAWLAGFGDDLGVPSQWNAQLAVAKLHELRCAAAPAQKGKRK